MTKPNKVLVTHSRSTEALRVVNDDAVRFDIDSSNLTPSAPSVSSTRTMPRDRVDEGDTDVDAVVVIVADTVLVKDSLEYLDGCCELEGSRVVRALYDGDFVSFVDALTADVAVFDDVIDMVEEYVMLRVDDADGAAEAEAHVALAEYDARLTEGCEDAVSLGEAESDPLDRELPDSLGDALEVRERAELGEELRVRAEEAVAVRVRESVDEADDEAVREFVDMSLTETKAQGETEQDAEPVDELTGVVVREPVLREDADVVKLDRALCVADKDSEALPDSKALSDALPVGESMAV